MHSLVIEPRPDWLFPTGPIEESDGEQLLRLRRHLAEVGVHLVDTVIVLADRWWSLHELTSGSTEWTMSSER